jgi:hypothetical protein
MGKERIFLQEVASAKKFLLEIDDRLLFEKSKGDANIPLYLSGKIQEGDLKNRNGRIYPWEYLKRDCIRYMEEEVKDRQAVGELDHPEEAVTPRLQFASHIIEDMSFRGKEVWAKIKVLNAYMPENSEGMKARGLLLNNVQLGISSRSLGSIEEKYDHNVGEYDEVQDDLSIICWDLVSRPSTVGADMRITESLKRKKNKVLYESQCFDGICGCNGHIKKQTLKSLNEDEKMYMNILGIEKYLQIINNK